MDTPQQNGRVEHKHHHILNVPRALRFHANLPIDFFCWGGWGCIVVAAYLISHTPTKLLKGKSPNEVLFKYTPSYNELHVFRTLYFTRNNLRPKGKFASRSKKCVLLGYPFGNKEWKMCDLETHEIFVSRDVAFFENTFSFRVGSSVQGFDTRDGLQMGYPHLFLTMD